MKNCEFKSFKKNIVTKAAACFFVLCVNESETIRTSAAALPDPTKSGIEHVIVVMMENRSFDHFFGWVPGAEGKQAGLTYTDRSGATHSTYPLAPDYQGCGHPDPDHSYQGGRIEFNNGACDGWLRSGSNDIYSIGYYTGNDFPFFNSAVKSGTVCDRYFAPIMAGTYPNRMYQHAAQTDRLDNSLKISTLPTIWDRLAAKNLTGRYYFSDLPFLALWGAKYLPIVRPIDSFFADCGAGKLPEVAFVEPRLLGEGQGVSGDDHPFADIRNGQVFLSKVFKAVTTSPNWTNSVLIINYDEWGGFFDHVPPEIAPVPPADKEAGNADGLRGFRVPCLIVSPWSPRGTVNHQTFDHTSVLSLIEWRWGLDSLTVRDRTAKNLAEALDFSLASLPVPSSVDVTGTFGAPCAAPLKVSTSGTNFIVNWTADAELQSAASILGPWKNLSEVQVPFTYSSTNSVQFFRLMNKWDSLVSVARQFGF